MEAQTRLGPTAQSRRRRLLIGALAGIAIAVAAFFIVRALTENDNEGGTLKSASAGFTLHYPSGWKPVSKGQLARTTGTPLAMLRQTDRRGILVVNRQARPTSDFSKVSAQLDRQLSKRLPDFKKVSSHTVGIKAGQAFLYSYIRTRRGTVHTTVVVPAGSRGYTLNAVVAVGAPEVARQVGAIIRSFDTNP
jgi:hypothetical protein